MVNDKNSGDLEIVIGSCHCSLRGSLVCISHGSGVGRWKSLGLLNSWIALALKSVSLASEDLTGEFLFGFNLGNKKSAELTGSCITDLTEALIGL